MAAVYFLRLNLSERNISVLCRFTCGLQAPCSRECERFSATVMYVRAQHLRL